MKNVLNKEYTATYESKTISFKEPELFNVVVYNDDYTPMEFVVGLLERFFCMDRRRAIAVSFEAHLKGKASVGLFSLDVAETKVGQVTEYARKFEHPLVCSTEVAA